MEFEYDPQKSRSNKNKHGIDFEEAQELWLDIDRIEIQAKCEDEPRYAMIASKDENLWTAFYTIRNQRIRIISVRRARKGERSIYHES